jgi:REP element-mobilizing transposase RayT
MPHARKDKINWIPGGYYHLYNRGARLVTIFREEKNYHFVLLKVKKYLKAFDLTAIAYCLMPNHYHFLVRQDGEVAAGLLPQRVFNSYSKAYNKLYGHSGTLFEGRFKAKPVTTENYLRHLCRYIHANPVKDGMALDIEEWQFSNYLEWIGERDGTLVDRQFVVDMFGDALTYKEFVRDYLVTRFLPDELRYLDDTR